ncbi:hypothetical protein EXIGLDRAFT_722402 [Exidia glandulosa HHB12029]|uniref:F-box domain-containing protein n=1 Tax=Exidia glandulosa HHB12029 TaxID=1314781 RepID=A0A165FC16_EXIGL|nr:hypothetical protein EXIGLDRAFT_722402 [Exidia glandulosa HHB12029]
MRLVSGIQRLPPELFCRSFSYLDVANLIDAAHVCSRWRVMAFDHPNYWAHIVVDTESHLALDLLSHRLTQGRGRRLSFVLSYTDRHELVPKRMIPLLQRAVPYARYLVIKVESLYRLHVEQALSQAAPNLERIELRYYAGTHPDLPLTLPLGKGNTLFLGEAARLRSVRLHSIILPTNPIAAFLDVEEVYWDHADTTYQEEFPCYLFDFFPKVKLLRMIGGTCWFTNVPLPQRILDIFKGLKWLDLQFMPDTITSFFHHLPLHGIPEMIISCPDEDGIYNALEPLRSPFHLSITQNVPKEFHITVTGDGQPGLIRHFAEAHRYYYRGSEFTNLLLQNDEFAAQLASFRIHTSRWTMLNPLLPSFSVLPKLIVELDDDTHKVATLPSEPVPCQELVTLVLQAAGDFIYLDAADVISFADRVTTRRIALELRRALIVGSRSLLDLRFESVLYSEEYYEADGQSRAAT